MPRTDFFRHFYPFRLIFLMRKRNHLAESDFPFSANWRFMLDFSLKNTPESPQNDGLKQDFFSNCRFPISLRTKTKCKLTFLLTYSLKSFHRPMLAFRFQKDRKNAPKAFSVYNLSFQNSTYFPTVFPSGRKYAILITPLLTFWHSDTLSNHRPGAGPS